MHPNTSGLLTKTHLKQVHANEISFPLSLLLLSDPDHAVINKYLPVSATQSYLYAKNIQFTKYMYCVTKLNSLAVISWSSLKGKNLTDVIGKP